MRIDKERAPSAEGALCLADGGVCAEGGEQGGEDGDHNLTDALQGVLCGVFHRNIILRVNNELNLNQA